MLAMMDQKNIPFQTIEWSKIERTEHKGETGIAYWQTVQFNGLRIRIVEYSPGYVADHWCEKGHCGYLLCGKMVIEYDDGEIIYNEGDGIFIPDGPEHKHKGRVLSDKALVFFIEKV